jgi:signal peptidase I
MEHQTNNTGSTSWLRIIFVGRNPKNTAIRVVVLVAVALVVFRYVLLPIRVSGPSMEPTYHNGRINFLNCLAYCWHEPKRGDVVGIRYSGRSIMLMKRIVGLPGETIAFKRGQIYKNGDLMEEPYVILRSRWNMDPVTLGSDEYYVVGDNRSMDIHDHDHGKVKRERIVGKVLL